MEEPRPCHSKLISIGEGDERARNFNYAKDVPLDGVISVLKINDERYTGQLSHLRCLKTVPHSLEPVSLFHDHDQVYDDLAD